MSNRIPDWVLERHAVGELPEGYTPEAIAQDPSVPARLLAIQQHNAKVLAEHPPADVAREVQRRAHLADVREQATRGSPVGRSLRVWLPVVATAAVVAVAAPGWWAQRQTSPDYLGIKGEPHLEVFRQAGAAAEKPIEHARVHQGDVLQLAVFAGDARFAVVVSIDGAGAVVLHAPQREGAAWAVRTGGTLPLPQSYALDSAPRFERFVLVTSPQPFDTGPVLSAARTVGADAAAALQLPEALRQTSFVVDKEAANP